MDPINIIILLNVIASFGANLGGAKKGLRSTITAAKEKPKTYLQTFPVVLSTITLILLIISLFQVGTFPYNDNNFVLRLIATIVYVIFSWVQIFAYKNLGENYSQEIMIFKNHKLIRTGMYKYIRHPQYLSQILIDLFGGFAVLSYILIPLAIIEIPFIILRALKEEELLKKNFKSEFEEYKKSSGFMIPFIG